MPRRLRSAPGGFVYHVLNRSVARDTLFAKPGDYAAFLKVLRQADAWQPMRLLAFCVIPTTGICSCGPTPTATCPNTCVG